ncbi:LytTR family DNA-binding domain-containing protein [Arenibacter sp. M-2]|uniref:LytR/AlgR family response regulator transcription factor n=1 Tax=unclassified Arenibacter TaxID=2615047 RepID=UPI000D762D44|nr:MULTISPECIES: LytTR family DNA-binding domain-containing protein [unclassified Arenibacter]MDL5514630.1 LytTR family DNA-binding domain-containing protein [Arenibacter sp. M-2]PXX22345.1 LytTR family two component transcriptional regulator [Arenibacter sp. ARW7G5Y1]|tara:strand:+ start:62939 stop:63664 length:726 start_codon:yes stop_codon:yes gene_type:complete
MNCIIIDDEPLAIDVLADYCKKIDFTEVVGTFTNPLDAIKIIKEKKVDVIFCDIEMPQISGLEFISALENRPLFIFTTAYAHYAVEGFELNAVDYLVKPIPYHRFIKAISRSKEILAQKVQPKEGNIFPSIGGQGDTQRFIFVKSEHENIKINLDDIEYIQGLKDYLKIHIKGTNKTILTLLSFKDLLDKLPQNQFIRVHKSFVVNVNVIKTIQRNRIVINDTRIPIGESHKTQFFAFLGL